MICHFKNLIYENILKVSIKICHSGEKSPVFFPEIYGEVEPALGNRSRPEAESVT